MRTAIALVVLLLVSPSLAAEPADRHRLAIQLGGSGFFQLVYRLRVLGPVHLEVGGFGAPHVVNASGGVLVDLVRRSAWSLYLAGGAGFAAVFGTAQADECIEADRGCEPSLSAEALAFGHARAGVQLRPWHSSHHALGLDAGLWSGTRLGDYGRTVDRDRFTIPMAGAAYVYAF